MNNQRVVCDEAEYAYACTRLLSDKQPDSSTFYGLATNFHNLIETTPRVTKVQTLDLDAIHKRAEAVAVKVAAEMSALVSVASEKHVVGSARCEQAARNERPGKAWPPVPIFKTISDDENA